MKNAIPVLLLAVVPAVAMADNDTTNSHNSQTSTQEITTTTTHDGLTDSHNIDNSLTTHDGATDSHAVDNSLASHNDIAIGSNNQDSHQVITNTNTEGDLQYSKNTGSLNTGSYNTDSSGSGNTLTASGGNSSSTSAGGSSQSDSNSSATGGAGGSSQSGSASTVTGSGNSANTNTLGSHSSAGVAGSGNSQNDNASRATNNGSGNSSTVVKSSSTYRQVHQAPALGSLFGQVSQNRFSAANSVGFNFSFLLGGFGFTLPWTNDRAELLIAAEELNKLFGFSAACNLMRDGDDEFRLAMNRANVNCNPITPPPAIAVPAHVDRAIPQDNNVIFDTVHKTVMQK